MTILVKPASYGKVDHRSNNNPIATDWWVTENSTDIRVIN
jgi:hypothetical protein